MASDAGPVSDLETQEEQQEEQEQHHLSTAQRKLYTFCGRRAFSSYVASKRGGGGDGGGGGGGGWRCCDQTFTEPSSVHKHVARTHQAEVLRLTESTFRGFLDQLEDNNNKACKGRDHPEPVDVSSWLPDTSHLTQEELQKSFFPMVFGFMFSIINVPFLNGLFPNISGSQKSLV